VVPDVQANRINLDAVLVFGGRLTTAVFETTNMNVCESVVRERVRELGAAPKRLLRRRQRDQEEHEIEGCSRNGRAALIEPPRHAERDTWKR
jgi:hypothetical protein